MKRKFSFNEISLDRMKRYGSNAEATGGAEPHATETATKPADTDTGLVTAVRTDIGKVRASNQDAVIDDAPLIGVCDGMGGHKAGDVASSTARDLLTQLLKHRTPDADALRTGVEAVNRRIFARQEDDDELHGMGTTMTVLWAAPDRMIIAHVGDSRCYLLRGGELRQVSQDHSLVAEMVREGLLTPEQAAAHPMRNMITRAVGTEPLIDVDIIEEPRQRGDVWLLCSDGLHGLVRDEQLRDTLLTHRPDEACALLVQAALDAGGTDNVSVAIVLDAEVSSHD